MSTNNLHKPIMVNEIMNMIKFKEKMHILDATFGGGGHSKFFLDKGAEVIGIDNYYYSQQIALQNKYYGSSFKFFKENFKNFDKILLKNNIKNKFDVVILDLGFSSNQLEDDSVGISFKKNLPLRMNYADYEVSAFEILNDYNEDKLTNIFKEYGEIKNSKKLSKYIIEYRKKNKINTTFDFIEVLKNSGVHFGSKKINFATKPFQALRIEANKELDNLEIFLKKINKFLNLNALIFIISFHSLEDRIVKNFFKQNAINKKFKFLNEKNWGYEILTKRPITPTKPELLSNPRSRSSKLRIGRYIC